MPNQKSKVPVKNSPSSEIWVTAQSITNDTNEVTIVKPDTRKKICNGICHFYEVSGLQYNVRYKAGQKRCTKCQVYMMTDMAKCPCCKTTLRTKPRSKRMWNQLEKIPAL